MIKWIQNALKISPIVLLAACGGNSAGTVNDTPTSGNVTISADETFQPIIETQVSTFQGIYKRASVTANYKTEGQVIKDLLNDSVRVAVISRELNQEEKEVFAQRKLVPRTTKIAIDAIALIVNNDNPDSLLTLEQVKSIFNGQTTKWNEINSANSLNNITIVFDNNNSSTARYVKDSLITDHKLPGNTYASNSHKDLIDYVEKNKNAIGVIGVNWISDEDDSASIDFLKRIRVVGISTESQPLSSDTYYQPYQAYIAQGNYPLYRYLYIVNTESRTGLGTGFASYAAGDGGQRIVLKSGLVPATQPIRVVSIKN
ncbi:PstS family phosphate ABC transporter substrate-binding protein [Pontibacter sp. SGAir0037]|uniref:PstS family phosphate ABC transporter substrate-binding protein n=1 Tax=Pontibacter sp. SGAir0037 TaxID=2571030 RepID=UPI0010CCBD7F|nr:substrate-binding domain-containing protein [Pontibacter sp. SGAir0037]QCR24301.1 phosphate ABC transporter substrate-binding protein, PhoT family [Pontibacter sp. SGAir0037]